MAEGVELSGFKELGDTFYDLGKTLGRSVLTRVGRAALEPMAEHARGTVKVKTGTLKRQIHVGTKLAKSQKLAVKRLAGGGDFRADAKSDVTVHMGPGQDPAAIQEEFGNYHQAADPFMRPAFDAEAEATVRRVGDGLWPEIDKAAAKRARKLARKSNA